MMSSNRGDYASALEWISALRQDEAWLSQQQCLQASAPDDADIHKEDALRRIGKGETFEFWEIYRHQVEPVICEVWDIAELSLPKLKIQAIGMLSMEWIEQHTPMGLCDQQQGVVERLKPIFYGSEEEAKAFLESIHGMKATQIIAKVNQLVADKKISDLSKHRDLWSVLNESKIYKRTESNWNQQVK